ncbi:MAG: 50S ribosomal protein L1 [Parcubacteria group bacterium GW2011_GWD2_43_10]|nr:MAG: 50S ribosomal protein L1 [Parcubacteria group bacterium GW2011_GWA2_42_80]KKS82514.1 MAG: 50S ribosomal protein L1 [Parcubacteria group bacterium GW2011_GWD2_43_10]KKT14123.1 MAG: 50S ribosomal protein L1 [Parcubacteria group bacterium GW2011_GWF2_43_38]HAO81352.1 50S ribosomal protein L1 [Candidatus Veblenbacteria bacterium]HBH16951.1 50S ribosomal protein L1 [Candidatus Veblenbacteria bacterium]
MSLRSKRYKEAAKLVEPGKLYSIEDGVKLLKQMPVTKFDSAIELHARLGIDVKQANQLVRGSVNLPHGAGKKIRIAVFCSDDKTKEAKAAGAQVVGGEELIKDIQSTKKCDFDIAIATPEMMKLLAPIAKILGQKGLMPNPKTETITPHAGEAVKKLIAGKVGFKADDTGNVHMAVGRLSFEESKLTDNIKAFVDVLKRTRPAAAKGTYFRSVTLTSSMGPAIRVNVI